MKLIGLDIGTKRIGVAKADSSTRIAVPYSAIDVDGTEFDKIASLARAWAIDSFVLGLPRSNEGNETQQSKYVRQFAKELKATLPNAKICFQDESLTSVEAEKRLKKRKKGYKKADIDSEAATIILQDFLETHTGKKTTTRATAARHKTVKANRPHRLATVIVIILALVVAAAGGGYYFYQQNLQPVFADTECDSSADAKTEPCKDIIFDVKNGASVSDVADELKSAGLIRNSLIFQLYYRLNASDQTIKPGEYTFNRAMSPAEILNTMIGGDDIVYTLTIFPGETIREIKAKLVKYGYAQDDIDEAFAKSYTGADYSWIFAGRPEGASLEGYIFGDTYEFYNTDTVETVIETTLRQLAAALQENNLEPAFAEQGLNLYQGITLASIVQKEANNAEDWAKVAQVFYNRIANNMSLGSDITTIYAIDLVDPERVSGMSEADKLAFDSPYNTRNPNVIGLPYGPVSNPGVAALIATAHPDRENASNYLYFLTGDDGMMYYSATDDEHNQNIIDHCQVLCGVSL